MPLSLNHIHKLIDSHISKRYIHLVDIDSDDRLEDEQIQHLIDTGTVDAGFTTWAKGQRENAISILAREIADSIVASLGAEEVAGLDIAGNVIKEYSQLLIDADASEPWNELARQTDVTASLALKSMPDEFARPDTAKDLIETLNLPPTFRNLESARKVCKQIKAGELIFPHVLLRTDAFTLIKLDSCGGYVPSGYIGFDVSGTVAEKFEIDLDIIPATTVIDSQGRKYLDTFGSRIFAGTEFIVKE